jgi:hypothetical protein
MCLQAVDALAIIHRQVSRAVSERRPSPDIEGQLLCNVTSITTSMNGNRCYQVKGDCGILEDYDVE